MSNDAVILQHVYNLDQCFIDMARLTYQRHAAYANSHKMDYWHFIGDGVRKDLSIFRGGWIKVALIKQAIEAGYEHIFWIDADAAVMDFSADLRDALQTGASPAGAVIGAVIHDPARSEYLRGLAVPRHYNVGVLYARSAALPLIDAWLSHFHDDLGRWLEQGAFNALAQESPYQEQVARVDDRWNATINVNPDPKPVVLGWHGIFPNARRLGMMQAALKDDHLKFRV